MVPLPGRRGDKEAYTFGQIPMPDGHYRFELWSLRDNDGHRTRLDTRTFALQDGRVDVTF
jgi:hypothetical protein